MGGSLSHTILWYVSLSLLPLPKLPLRTFMILLRVTGLHEAFIYSSANQYRNAVPASQGSCEAPLILEMHFKIIK